MSNNNQQILLSQISNRPFCADSFDEGIYRENKDKALKKKHIQLNNSVRKHCMTFDLDYEMSFLADDFADLPTAHMKVRNNANGHTHLTYFLNSPVFVAGNARLAPMRYLSAIEDHFRSRLNADPRYTGLITKNPFSPEWFTTWSNEEPYSLDYLADFVREDTTPEKTKAVSYGIGRNVNLFESLRLYAYRHVLEFKKTSTLSKWYAELEIQAVNINISENANNLLPYNELKSTASSIARWTWQNFNNTNFSKIQSQRGRKGGLANIGKQKTKGRKKQNIKDMIKFIGDK
ncbi:replication initiation protein [Providencia rettgeri]